MGSLLSEAWQKEKDGKQIRANKEKGKVNYSLKMHARLGPCLLPKFFAKYKIVTLSFVFDKYYPIID